MKISAKTRKALRAGRAIADEVIARRKSALRRRAAALRKLPARRRVDTRSAPPRVITALRAAAGSAGVLVAEGDSWFDYPLNDVLSLLEDEHGYDVESVAHAGDRVEDMAYSGGQLEKFTRTIEKVLRRGIVPRAILISGGGNDVAGDQFGMLLNHAGSAIGGLNEKIVSGVIDERARYAYITLLSAVTRICDQHAQTRVPILVHGYGHAIPDGRGFLGGWWILPGPWLEPGFREKGFDDPDDCRRMVKELIDRFNQMLSSVARLPEFAHVKYIDVRNLLSSGSDYRSFWANELHPTARGFKLVAERFAAAI
ncbi:MAG: GDSL-type esterase/lipase family protein [Candidatus Binatia bacterium]